MVDGGHMVDLENLSYDDLDTVPKLQKTLRYIDTMLKVEKGLDDMSKDGNNPEYELIINCNALLIDIENEIDNIHDFIRDKYRLKFSELLVHHPVDYAPVVKRIGNEMDLTLVDLEGLVPSAIIIAASTTSGKPLPEEVLRKTIDACDHALGLDSSKKKVFDCVESRMGNIGPNLSAFVGSEVAAKLMGAAGGLSALANMPGCYVQRLGAEKNQCFVSYIEQAKICQNTPFFLRKRACRLVSSKSTLAARLDSNGGDSTGKTGRAFRDGILKKIEKWQEPPVLAKQPS